MSKTARRSTDQDRRTQAATAAWQVFVDALDAVTDPVARAVLELHKADDRAECTGCDADGYECDYPAWPCRTTTTVARAVGIAVPQDLELAEQSRGW